MLINRLILRAYKLFFILLLFLQRKFDSNLWRLSLTSLIVLTPFITTAQVSIISEAVITGQYDYSGNQFNGTVRYFLNQIGKDEIIFHLPPNWNRHKDRRKSYSLLGADLTAQNIPREDLSSLEQHHHDNIHLARSIDIMSVSIGGQSIPYQIVDNSLLLPHLSAKDSLLVVNPYFRNQAIDDTVWLEINFTTRFFPLPNGFQRTIWDFAPRLMWQDDRRGVISHPARYSYDITVKNLDRDEKSRRITFSETQSHPVVLIDLDQKVLSGIQTQADRFIEKQLPSLSQYVDRVFLFLVEDGWLAGGLENYKLVIWDGGITASGNTLLLPRSLFRYHQLFHISFETAVIKAIVKAEIRKRFVMDASLSTWILPAIQAEVIRAYVESVYQGNTRQFPWIDWMNLDYPLENTINDWIVNSRGKTVIIADDPIDLAYSLENYHPAYPRGVHLLWLIHGGADQKITRVRNTIKQMLSQSTWDIQNLDQSLFFDLFPDTAHVAKRWVGSDTRVDYALEDVVLITKDDGVIEAQVTISNNGDFSPSLEIGFVFDGGGAVSHILQDPVGSRAFMLPEAPVQILLDPARQLLEDDILNNSWELPLKMRPFGDFLSADRWVFGVYPLLGGNTFDSNLLGVSFSLDYMALTSLAANVFISPTNGNLLWEGTAFHQGYPFKQSELSLEISQLSASKSVMVGIEQPFTVAHRDYSAELFLWKERLQNLVIGSAVIPESSWIGMEASLTATVLKRAFFDWQIGLTASNVASDTSKSTSYGKYAVFQSFENSTPLFKIHLNAGLGNSIGEVPIQKKYPLGGVKGFPGYPREIALLFDRYEILEFGIEGDSIFEYLDANLSRAIWLQYIVPSIYFHFGNGHEGYVYETKDFRDIEIRFQAVGEFFNRFQEIFQVSFAFPIDDPIYREGRLILESSWVF